MEGMVLQRGMETGVQGQAIPGAVVSIEFLGSQSSCLAGEDGTWLILLPAKTAGGPYSISITADMEKVTIQDVWVGDVWLCGGQSNMEMKMERVRQMFPEAMEVPSNPNIRQFEVPQSPKFNEPRAYLEGGRWEAVSSETITDFTAVGYFFAKRLYEKYSVPIGLIAAAVGGTPIHAWLPLGILKDDTDAVSEVEACARDGYIETIQEEETTFTQAYMSALDRDDDGLREGWQELTYNDRLWPERSLCEPWDDDLSKPGIIWFRKKLTIPASLAGKPATLFLGTIVDAETAYFNGTPLGSTDYRYPPREYSIPSLPEGSCVISLRVQNKHGLGGFTPGKPRALICQGRGIPLNDTWKYRRGTVQPPMPLQTNFTYKPTGLFNGMIMPVRHWAIKGVIWYQGESDTDRAERYDEKCVALVKCWRELWGFQYPFLSVQLPYYAETYGVDWEPLRKAQMAILSQPDTAIVFSQDIGEYNDLHPQNKLMIGERLARAAMVIAYGEILPPSPLWISCIPS